MSDDSESSLELKKRDHPESVRNIVYFAHFNIFLVLGVKNLTTPHFEEKRHQRKL